MYELVKANLERPRANIHYELSYWKSLAKAT
jgi:hypothetical protein